MMRVKKSKADSKAKRPWSMARLGLLATSLSLAGISGALADVTKGQDALDRGDFETALQQFNAAALGGDAEGSYQLGQMYSDGLGVNEDMVQALKWFLCAEAGGGATGLKAQAMGLRASSGMSDQDIAQAKDLAAGCVAKAGQNATGSTTESKTLKSFWGEWTIAEGEDPETERSTRGPQTDPLAYEPKRYGGLAGVFLAPAEATLEVAKEAALAVGATRVANSFYSVKLEGNKIVLGLLALFWWFLVFRVVYFLKEQLLDQEGSASVEGDSRNKKLERQLYK